MNKQPIKIIARKAVKKALRLFFDTNNSFFFSRDLAQEVSRITPMIPAEIDFHSTLKTILWLGKREEPWMFNNREIEVALKESHLYPQIRRNGEIIGYLKVGVKKVYIEDFKRVVTLPAESAFIYDTFVLDSLRGNKLASFMIGETMKFLKDSGIKKIYCHIPPWNAASINTYSKSGFKRSGTIRHICILRLIKFEIER